MRSLQGLFRAHLHQPKQVPGQGSSGLVYVICCSTLCKSFQTCSNSCIGGRWAISLICRGVCAHYAVLGFTPFHDNSAPSSLQVHIASPAHKLSAVYTNIPLTRCPCQVWLAMLLPPMSMQARYCSTVCQSINSQPSGCSAAVGTVAARRQRRQRDALVDCGWAALSIHACRHVQPRLQTAHWLILKKCLTGMSDTSWERNALAKPQGSTTRLCALAPPGAVCGLLCTVPWRQGYRFLRVRTTSDSTLQAQPGRGRTAVRALVVVQAHVVGRDVRVGVGPAGEHHRTAHGLHVAPPLLRQQLHRALEARKADLARALRRRSPTLCLGSTRPLLLELVQ